MQMERLHALAGVTRIDMSGRRRTVAGIILRCASGSSSCLVPRASFAQDALDRALADLVASSQLDQRRSG